ncbi:hypothetical protein [Flavobacterium aquidurense]|uniref:hypothetical protein n=1 Tax=Flavobacterium aquidurense TaxID=362413 RepID=UPI00285D56E8|nr:hypothetical protein [Flavobacterium aquidurense]MDR7372884.1 hypothetical protein [Flavobacterium aquidurense]
MKISVLDNKGCFLKMFKKKFKDEYDFTVGVDLSSEENEFSLDCLVVALYNDSDLMEFLKLRQKGLNVILFVHYNKELFYNLVYLEDRTGLVVIDASGTKMEIFKDLKKHFSYAQQQSNIHAIAC